MLYDQAPSPALCGFSKLHKVIYRKLNRKQLLFASRSDSCLQWLDWIPWCNPTNKADPLSPETNRMWAKMHCSKYSWKKNNNVFIKKDGLMCVMELGWQSKLSCFFKRSKKIPPLFNYLLWDKTDLASHSHKSQFWKLLTEYFNLVKIHELLLWE